MGVSQNYTEAMKWYLKAAEQGNSEAQYRLGYCYEYRSIGGAKNLSEAISWYLKSAEQGNDEAKKALKRMNISTKFPKQKK